VAVVVSTRADVPVLIGSAAWCDPGRSPAGNEDAGAGGVTPSAVVEALVSDPAECHDDLERDDAVQKNRPHRVGGPQADPDEGADQGDIGDA
jgi:hypothetical protein